MKSLLCESFERVHRDGKSRVAIQALSEGRSLTFDDVAAASEDLDSDFERLGLERRRPIALLVGNHSSFLPLLLACLRRGLVVLPLDGDSPLLEALRVARQFEAQALVALDGQPPGDTAAGWVPLAGPLRLLRLPVPACSLDFGDAALLKLTSGSTDLPKAVLCTEDNLWQDGQHVAEAMGIGPTSVQLAAIPLSHSYALGNLVLPLLAQGARLVLRHGFIPPSFHRDVEACGVTVFPGVPFMFDRMLNEMALERLPRPLATLITAGAPISLETVLGFQRKFGVKIHSFYGSSETGGIAYDGSDTVVEPLTVGTALPGVTISLESAGADVVAGAGRVMVQSGAVAVGYAGELAAAEGPFSVGGSSARGQAGTAADATGVRFLTADIGRVDERGRLYLLGRVSEAVNVAGRKVLPEEVERVLLDLDSVSEVKVLGVADAVRGEHLVACVVPRDRREPPTPLALRQYCARHLAPFKIPRTFLVLDGLPATSRGKVDRKAIEAMIRGLTPDLRG